MIFNFKQHRKWLSVATLQEFPWQELRNFDGKFLRNLKIEKIESCKLAKSEQISLTLKVNLVLKFDDSLFICF